MEKINEIIHEKISILFKLSHNKSLKLSIEILKLLFGIITTQDQNFVDRYYKSLYELISNSSLSSSKHVKEALKLILMSLMFDNNNNRICSFIKRLLEMSLISEPQYIICNLLIISQVLRNKNKLWKMLEREQTKINVFYDAAKRDPQYAQGEHSFLNELYLLQKHYHPSVQRMSKFILQNYNKEIISYDGDPLVDFSLINFLEKFMLKNPKIKKVKKETKVIENDDDELKKFLKGDEDNQNNDNIKDNDNEKEKNENDFEFIEKFNKIYPEITSDKNYIKKKKKKEKKLKDEDDIDDLIGDKEFDQDKKEDIDLEQFADKVIEDEYKKFGKDIDDDDLGDYQDGDEDENENEEEEEKNGDNEEEDGENEEGDEENEDIDENEEEVEDLFTEDEDEEEGEFDEDEEDIEEENNTKKNKKRNKDEKESGFVDAEEYYKNLKNKNKNKNKKKKLK
jgi:ribosome biogenesis protein MAK21